ncbi:hypothetical protein ILUMI_09255 [Ignelater luminosus]|uniref:Fatty acyl-CoA reductase n=1 Tax=Ignelater luminosus TaxID=2038154 RepID=A0A8K0D0C1_IGNLU|nr:hypothetical protein ILUMI_09255 [Ignelater luminosus]
MDYKFPELPDPKLRGQGPISEWYKGRSIFITGATGFMGKVLLEKLLYQSEVERVYILIRSKRGRFPHQRIEDMWKLPMFHRCRKDCPEVLNKIVPLYGDVITKNFGLTVEDRKLLIDNVSVVFHCAATLKLEAELKDAIEMNTEGTQKVLELAREMKKLDVFVHLSTAFCSADIDELEEKIYPTPDNPSDVIQVVKWMSRDALVQATPAILKHHPNTYTYSKRLAETLVADEYPKLPVVVARPSIVTPASIEPLPGWVDSLNGPMGIVVGGGKGVIRSVHAIPENRAQVVPVDVAISALIVIAWKMGSATVKPPTIPVYNLTNDGAKRMTWGDILQKGKRIGHKYPFETMIWYPDGDIRPSKFRHDVCCFFYHWIPAYLIDFLMLIFRQKRFMVRLQKKIHFGLELLQFFTTREWIFKSENFLNLTSDMTPTDRQAYPMDFNAMPVEDYFTITYLGARQYLMKEDLSTIPRWRIIQNILYVVDRAFALAFYFGLIWLLCQCSHTVKDAFDLVGSYLQQVPVLGMLIPISEKNH